MKYFNNWEREEIRKGTDTDPYNTLKNMQGYIERYPLDYIAYIQYIRLLIDTKNLDEAEKMFSLIDKDSKIYKEYRKHTPIMIKKEIDSEFLRERLRYLIFSGNYQEAYELCREKKLRMKDHAGSVFVAELFLEKKLGLQTISTREGYLRDQVIDYSEERFFDKIQKHFDGRDGLNYFTVDFPYNDIIKEIKTLIPNDKSTYTNLFSEKYTFKYDFCGIDSVKNTDYFQVITLVNSNELITMYPFNEGENYRYIDLNYLKEKEKVKIKKSSQIDKFNKKYSDFL